MTTLRDYQTRTIDQLYAWFGEGVYSSKELLANPAACAEGDALLMGMRKEWDGRVVG